MLNTIEHIELMEQFEKTFKYERLDKEDRTLWPRGIIYQNGQTNALFLAYRHGYAFGKCVVRLEHA
jgi:uncharacterized membrane protein